MRIFRAGIFLSLYLGAFSGSSVFGQAYDPIQSQFTAIDHSYYFLDDAGTNYVLLRAPSSLSSNIALTLPSTVGSDGQLLSTDGAGALGWTSYIKGSPTGAAVSAGNVGEEQTLALSLSSTSCAANADTDNLSMVTIPAGNWWLNVFVIIDNVPASGLTGVDGGVWIGSVISGTAILMTANTPPGRDGFLASIPRYVSFSSPTVLSMRVHPVGTGITLRNTGSTVQIVRAG